VVGVRGESRAIYKWSHFLHHGVNILEPLLTSSFCLPVIGPYKGPNGQDKRLSRVCESVSDSDYIIHPIHRPAAGAGAQ